MVAIDFMKPARIERPKGLALPGQAAGDEGPFLLIALTARGPARAGGGGIPPEFAAFVSGGAANAGLGQNVTPNAQPLRISPLEPDPNAAPERPQPDAAAEFRRMAGQFGVSIDDARPRLMVTADGGSRMGKSVLYKSLVDESIKLEIGRAHV